MFRSIAGHLMQRGQNVRYWRSSIGGVLGAPIRELAPFDELRAEAIDVGAAREQVREELPQAVRPRSALPAFPRTTRVARIPSTRLPEGLARRGVRSILRDTEVCEFPRSAYRQHVLGLEIAVDDSLGKSSSGVAAGEFLGELLDELLVRRLGPDGVRACPLGHVKPSVVLPFIFEQQLWARRLQQVGAWGKFVSFWKATPERVAGKIRQAMGFEPMRRKALELASAMATEDGTGVATRLLERLVAPRSCDLVPVFASTSPAPRA